MRFIFRSPTRFWLIIGQMVRRREACRALRLSLAVVRSIAPDFDARMIVWGMDGGVTDWHVRPEFSSGQPFVLCFCDDAQLISFLQGTAPHLRLV
jgi:hypothetical protein